MSSIICSISLLEKNKLRLNEESMKKLKDTIRLAGGDEAATRKIWEAIYDDLQQTLWDHGDEGAEDEEEEWDESWSDEEKENRPPSDKKTISANEDH